MHYKNGRKAIKGDLVIGMTYNKPSVQIGKVLRIRISTNPEEVKNCNVTLQLPSKTPWGAFEQEYSQCDWLLHIDDAWPFIMLAWQPYSEVDWFAKCHNLTMKWNNPQPETRGLNAKED